jgi:hypothetical protein
LRRRGSTRATSPGAGPRRPGRAAEPILNGVTGDITGTPAPGSKFGRLQIGMSQKQVEDLIGPPTDSSAHITGKQFIPFYFGGDTNRVEQYYKGEGILTFGNSSFGNMTQLLLAIQVNPNEGGYAH